MQLPNTRWSDGLFFYLAILATLFALFMHFGIASTNISRREWAIPARFVRSHLKKGDAIGLMPSWALKAAEQLRGTPLLLAEHLPSEDLNRYRRLWVLVAPRLGKWWFRKAFRKEIAQLKKLYWLKLKKKFGKIELYLFQLPPAQPLLFDFYAKKNLRLAEVSLETPPSKDPRCHSGPMGSVEWLTSWREHPGWFMGRRGYFFGRLIQEIDNTPRDCLWAYPLRCKILRVRYRNVPLRGELLLEHGFTTPAPRGITPTIPPSGPDVLISLWIENRFIKKFRIATKEIWKKHLIKLDPFHFQHLRGSVEFRIQVPGRRSRHPGYCFRAEIRKSFPR